MKLSHHHIHRPDASSQLAAALGVEKVYFVDEPLWYLRLTSHFRLNWRREAASVVRRCSRWASPWASWWGISSRARPEPAWT